VELSPEEIRVLGCLVEKELTTPQQYPLTLNALVLACNQSSNRDPVVDYDEFTVEEAVTRAKTRGLARFVHPSHGRSALRYRHELAEMLGLDGRQLALLAVMMLRGPQTPGELRARTERMAGFETLADVESELDAMARREVPLAVRLARAPGHKEDRFAHTFGPLPQLDVVAATAIWPEAGPPNAPVGEQLEQLRADIDALRRDLRELREKIEG